MKTILHVGCGKQSLPDFGFEYQEVRMDIDPDCEPDIIGSLTDMGDIGPFDMVYGCHVLEHFAPHDVKKVISECYRVLAPGGALVMIVPNLEGIKPTREPLYESDAGWICGLDMYYGKEDFVEKNPWMAHKTGFVRETLVEALSIFTVVKVTVERFNLIGAAGKGCDDAARA